MTRQQTPSDSRDLLDELVGPNLEVRARRQVRRARRQSDAHELPSTGDRAAERSRDGTGDE